MTLDGRFRSFLFFLCSGVGEREGASEEVAAGLVFIENRAKGGGVSCEEGRGTGREGVCGDGGALLFFSQPKLLAKE